MMKTTVLRPFACIASAGLLATALIGGCESDSSSSTTKEAKAANDRMELDSKAAATVSTFRATDPSMSRFFDTAAGYAVFPTISEGALLVGGSHGDGVLYENGRIVGDVDVSAGSIGLQVGGQVYSEIIFFKTSQELSKFKSGNFEFDGKASAVAVRAGASAAADYTDGVAVFAFSEKGLMAQAAIGGQKFKYTAR